MISVNTGVSDGKILFNKSNGSDGIVLLYEDNTMPTQLCSQLIVSNAGTTSVNGTYYIAGTYNGYNLYTKDSNPNSYPRIRYNSADAYWQIIGTSPFVGAELYYSTDFNSCPALANWETRFGLPEAPTFTIIN
jgi:hypothetical protein